MTRGKPESVGAAGSRKNSSRGGAGGNGNPIWPGSILHDGPDLVTDLGRAYREGRLDRARYERQGETFSLDQVHEMLNGAGLRLAGVEDPGTQYFVVTARQCTACPRKVRGESNGRFPSRNGQLGHFADGRGE